MKTIIVASDFSIVSNDATRYALDAAKVLKARVVLFHLHLVSVHVSNARLSPQALQSSMDQNRNMVVERASKLSEEYGVEIIAEWRTGEFYEEMTKVINTYNADVLVMGMAEKSIEQDLLGNTTTAAINKLKFPILAVPNGARFEGVKKILFACDIVRGVQGKILQEVRKVALLFGAEVVIFHVSEKMKSIAEQELPSHLVHAFGDGLDGIIYSYKNVASNAVISAIESEINQIEADMVIMVPYKYGFWGSLVHKSKTRAMASGNSKPLLSIPI